MDKPRLKRSPHPRSASTLLLPDGVLIEDVAEGCRVTMMSFVDGVGAGWGKAELAHWLAGPYRTLTSFARNAGMMAPPSGRAADHTKLDKDRLSTLIRSVRWTALAALEGALPPDNNVSFATTALYAGHVVRCLDAEGRAGWAPYDASSMRLGDRLLSLVAADYLVRSEDYGNKLSVCRFCERVSFDEETRKRGACQSHQRPHLSGMRPRVDVPEKHGTLRGLSPENGETPAAGGKTRR